MPRLLVAFVKQHGRRRGRLGEMRIKSMFINVREEGRHAIKVGLQYRIVLMVMAARALERQSQESHAIGDDAIRDVGDAELLLDAAALVRLPVQAIEGGGQTLIARWLGQQVAGSLREDKLVVGQVVI